MQPVDRPPNGPMPDQTLDETLEEMNRLWTIAKAFSTTAHDVNNALQVISGSAELLATRTDLDPAILRRVEAVRVQAGKAASTIERLLTYSRGATGAGGKVDLAALADTAVSMRACSLGRLRITAEVARSDDQPYMVAGQSPRLLQLLLNLILSFEGLLTELNGGTIRITLERRTATIGTIAVVVQAKGNGPIPQNASGVSPLATDAEAGGPLWAASRLAAAQQGTLTVESQDGAATATLQIGTA